MENENKLTKNFIIATFVTLYVMVSVISTIHVITFFELSNPKWLAITLALAFEVGAAASLASIIALKKMNKTIVWVLFFILTAMQAMGNAYFAYVNLKDYKEWIELFGLVDYEPIFQKRILSIVSGAILPLVALGFIKSLVDYIRPEPLEANVNPQIMDSVTSENPPKESNDLDDVAKKVWDTVEELREEGKLPNPTEEDIKNEPTALANSGHINFYDDDEDYFMGDDGDYFASEESLTDLVLDEKPKYAEEEIVENEYVVDKNDEEIQEEITSVENITENIIGDSIVEEKISEDLVSEKPIEIIIDNKEVYPVYDEPKKEKSPAIDNIMVFKNENQ